MLPLPSVTLWVELAAPAPRVTKSLPLPSVTESVAPDAVAPVDVKDTTALSFAPLSVMPLVTASPPIVICAPAVKVKVRRTGAEASVSVTTAPPVLLTERLVSAASLKAPMLAAPDPLSVMVRDVELLLTAPSCTACVPAMLRTARVLSFNPVKVVAVLPAVSSIASITAASASVLVISSAALPEIFNACRLISVTVAMALAAPPLESETRFRVPVPFPRLSCSVSWARLCAPSPVDPRLMVTASDVPVLSDVASVTP